jgi:hypothetical protein
MRTRVVGRDGEHDDGVGEHQSVPALHHRPRQEAVLRDEAGQCRKTVEAGVGTEEQNRRARRLQQGKQDVAEGTATEDRSGDLGQHRRVSGGVWGRVSDVGQPNDAEQQEPEQACHHGQRLAGVRALRLAEDIDRVGDRLDAGQRCATVGERAQKYQDRGAHDDAVALVNLHGPGDVLRIVFR